MILEAITLTRIKVLYPAKTALENKETPNLRFCTIWKIFTTVTIVNSIFSNSEIYFKREFGTSYTTNIKI